MLIALPLLVCAGSLLAQNGNGAANGNGNGGSKAAPAKPGTTATITDAAGRVHVYHAPVTDTHRKEVGKRMKAAKFNKGKKK